MKSRLFSVLMVVFLAGCGGKSNNPTPGGGSTPVPVPAQSTLSLPAQNAACTTGTVISATQSSITFTWTASANTDSYELDIKNLLDKTTSTQSTSGTQLVVTLLRNTPYSWHIVSKSNKATATAQSNTWKFYNAGPGAVSYAPFPADIISPSFGQQITSPSGSINLTWNGSSVDNATLTYDVYFGTSSSPALFKSDVTNKFLNGVSVTSGTAYYWKVISKDPNGNTSDSGVYQFSVN